MWRSICILVVLVIWQDCVFAQYGGMQQIFEQKCRKHSDNPNAFMELQDEGAQFSKCFKDELSALVNGKTTCNAMKLEISRCAERVLRKVRLCVSSQESYLYDFGKQAVHNGLNYLCEGTNFQAIFNEDGMSCLRDGDNTSIDTCYKLQESTRENVGGEVIVAKEALCKDMKALSSCMGNYAQLKCPHIPSFRSNLTQLLYKVRYPCRHPTNGSPGHYPIFFTMFLTTSFGIALMKLLY